MIEAIGAGVSTSPSPGRLHSRRTHPGRRGRRRVAAYRRRAATFAGDKQTPVPFLRSSGPWRLAVGPPATPATSRRRKSATNVDLQNPNSTRPLRRPASHRPRRRLLRAVAQPALPRPAPPYAVGRLRTEVASCKLQNAILPVVDNTSARKLEKVSEMSLGYAEKLSYREDVGAVGMPEMFDPPEVVQDKIEELAVMVQKSKHLVVFTGAGISTSSGIPDFRGPKGVWTLQRAGKGVPNASLPFHRAVPSLTHMALVELERTGLLKFVISQDVLPPEEMNSAKEHCRSADLVLCLGTSLQITPACNMPLMSIKNGGRVAIVNLQATPKDKKASLVIHGLVDKVIAGVMSKLNLRIPPYIRTDFVQITLRHSLKKKCVRWTLRVTSIHGLRAPLPFLQSIKVSFPERPDMKPVVLKEQPFSLQRETSMNRSFFMLLTLNFTDGCSCLSSSIGWPVDFLKQKDNFARDRTLVLRQLQCASEHECCAGQQEILERECLPRAETAIHAIVTNVVRYDIEDEKLAPAKDGLMVHNSTSSPAKRPMGSTDCQRSRRTFRKTR
ncbi:hypothetical protein U9M48_031110 [Paspalum notatum var. saurae]|uniref:protein acetyllysine N-acetyltransferase n=1 Tax=Paspalum notatum var. saurae TaxID=547442 RepID=A0AAQ3U1Z1_PASNO